MRFFWLYPMIPIACLPIAHWYVFLGLWLWWGYGTRPAQTPSKVNGSISRCVVLSGSISASLQAMKESFSSLTSKYSMRPMQDKPVRKNLLKYEMIYHHVRNLQTSWCLCWVRRYDVVWPAKLRVLQWYTDDKDDLRQYEYKCSVANAMYESIRRHQSILCVSLYGKSKPK